MDNVYFSTGCLLLDLVVGGAPNVYGFPAGKFINIVGDKSVGKTFLSNEIIASAYHKYGKDKFKWVYDDCEAGYSFNSTEMYGFEIIPENPVRSTYVEEAFYNITKFASSLKKGQFGIYVLDSLDALTSIEQDERAEERIKAFDKGKVFDKGTYAMGKQKYLSQEFFPQLCSLVQSKNILVIIISQIREKIEMFSFQKYNRSGGKAMDFYAHTVFWLATGKKILKKERAVGVCVQAKTTKSKTPRPYREAFFTFLYDYGLDDIGTCVDYLFDLRTEKGELNTKAKAIKWNESADKKLNLTSMKIFLRDTMLDDDNKLSLLELYQNSGYYDGKVELDTALEFIQSNKKYNALFTECFGESMTRNDLISYIEDNDLTAELHERVIEKWEEVEASIKSNRKKKYATIPESD